MSIQYQLLRGRIAKRCLDISAWSAEQQEAQWMRRTALATRTMALIAHDRIVDGRSVRRVFQ